MLARCVRQILRHPVACPAALRSLDSSYQGVRLQPLPAALHGAQARGLQRTVPVQMGRRSAKIATRKGRSDQLKSKLFGKMGKEIVQAVRAGGPDATSNSRLKDLLMRARQSNVPRDIIDRNIKRASAKGQADFSEVLYEARGPGGAGFIAAALTDNLNRTAAEVRTAVQKGGGKMADAGSVLFNFQRKGVILVEPFVSEDEVLDAAADAGADDVKPMQEDGHITGFKVSTAAENFMSVYRALEDSMLPVREGSLQYVPLSAPALDDDAVEANEKLHDLLLAVDDVDEIFFDHEPKDFWGACLMLEKLTPHVWEHTWAAQPHRT